jgi:hypothetical protein
MGSERFTAGSELANTAVSQNKSKPPVKAVLSAKSTLRGRFAPIEASEFRGRRGGRIKSAII